MKIHLSTCLILCISILGNAENDSIIDSLNEKTVNPLTETNAIINTGEGVNDISYPPRQPETKISDIVEAAKGLKNEVHSLDTAMVNDVKREGLMTSIRKHSKFYMSIGFFVVLFLIWLRTRDKHR